MGLTALAGLLLGAAVAPAQSGNPFKDGWEKLSGAFSSKPAPIAEEKLEDSVSLSGRSRPTANTYVAIARLYEQSGKLDEAEKQYQVALKENSKDLAAMLGYARLKERQSKPDEALALYQKAAKTYPQEAAAFNNLGLCHARRGKYDEALTALGRAALLQPKNALYRNNIATVLVEMNRMQEAYSHLRVVHSEAACYYNLGFLLNKKGKTQEAAQHFAVAYRLDPSLVQAKEWLDRLGVPASPPPGPAQPGPAMVAPRGPQPATASQRPPVHVSQRPLPPSSLPGPARPREVHPQPRDFSPLPADGMPPMPPDAGPLSPLPPVHGGPSGEPEIAPLPPVR